MEPKKIDRFKSKRLLETTIRGHRRSVSQLILSILLVVAAETWSARAQTVANLTNPNAAGLNLTLPTPASATVVVTGTMGVGTIANTGTITLNKGGTLQIGSNPPFVPTNIMLTGGGTITLAGGFLTGVVNAVGTRTGLVNRNNSINGTGTIVNLALTNNATINANVAGSTLTLANSVTRNAGTLQANGGGTLTISDSGVGFGRLTNQPNSAGQGGSILALNGSTVNLSNIAVNGGFLDTAGSGVINGSGVSLANLAVNGTYNVVTGTTTSIPNGQRIRNNGTINVPAGGTFQGARLINGNNISAAAGSTIALSDFTQTDGTTVADGTLDSPQIDILGGDLTGAGTLTGTVNLAGTLTPGDFGPGPIDITGLYDQTASGIFNELLGGNIPGQYSQALITGSSTLDGLLEVSLVDGFQPSSGDVFGILEAGSGFTGYFSDAVPLGTGLPGLLHVSAGTFDVNYNVEFDGSLAVTLTGFTPTTAPEPANSLLLGTGLIVLALLMRRSGALRRLCIRAQPAAR